jgi:ABC-type uncharacterized transport system substrate-binding protein
VSILLTELVAKRLELITEMAGAKTIALLVNPNGPEAEPAIRTAEAGARQKGLLLPILKAGTTQEIDAAFAALAELHADALLVGNDPFYFFRRKQLAALAARHAVPTIHFLREFVIAGGLFSYGPSITDTYRQVGLYAAKILKGEKPADLPVQQPTKFELVINLPAAKALGITVPPSLLARADEVIE